MMIATDRPKTPVDSIEIPDPFVTLCSGWYGGADCLLYAVASTGGLTTGTHRPWACDSDEKWYLTLWRGFSSDIGIAVRTAEKGCNAGDGGDGDGGDGDGGDGDGHDADYPELAEFEAWTDGIVERLASDWRANTVLPTGMLLTIRPITLIPTRGNDYGDSSR